MDIKLGCLELLQISSKIRFSKTISKFTSDLIFLFGLFSSFWLDLKSHLLREVWASAGFCSICFILFDLTNFRSRSVWVRVQKDYKDAVLAEAEARARARARVEAGVFPGSVYFMHGSSCICSYAGMYIYIYTESLLICCYR